MAAFDRNRRNVRGATVVLLVLFALVPIANVLWPGPIPADPTQPRQPLTTSPFPMFRMGPVLHVVSLDPASNLSTRLLMTSLQGLVNRDQVELYLDTQGVAGDTSDMLTFLAGRYRVAHDIMSMSAALTTYASRAAGLVVFDPSRPESINVGTMIAAQRNAILVGPDLAAWATAQTGLPIVFDYATSPWAGLDAIGATDRALHELGPFTGSSLLAILPPDRWAIRDYLVATRTFVFYFPQGVLASPTETAATKRVLHATSRGIPILGWFDSPTLTEENSFIQLASAEGKFMVGAQDVPNLSVLTALGRNVTRVQSAPSAAAPLEDTTYVVLAVPDGDNLDFVAQRMWDLWSEPVRGTVPFAWSLNPLVADLAPPFLDRYYDTATPLDRFIAAPSGAGYLYPDYATPDDVASFVAGSKRAMEATGMDVLWLLNAFTASEISYTPASLSAYVDGVRPKGIVLDYDDQPRTQDAWMQEGRFAVAPVVRSTHFWTTRDNVLAKLDASRVQGEPGPRFIWLTIYTFRFDLRDAVALVDTLKERAGGQLEVVTPTQFFDLLQQEFLSAAHGRLGEVQEDRFASALFGARLASVRAQLSEADSLMAAGNVSGAAAVAFRGLQELRDLSLEGTLLLSLGVLVAAGALAFLAGRTRRKRSVRVASVRPVSIVLIAAAVAFLVFALREALEQNFWTYPTILLGMAVAGLHRPLGRWIDRTYPRGAPVVAALAALVLAALAIRTTAAFPLAMISVFVALDVYLRRCAPGPADVCAGLGFGTAIGLLGSFDLPTFTGIALVLVFSAARARGRPAPSEGPGGTPWRAGFTLALSLFGLAVAFYYALALRLELQGDSLGVVAAVLLVLGPSLALFLHRILPPWTPRAIGSLGLTAATAVAGLLLVVHGTVLTFLLLLSLSTSLSLSALAALAESEDRGGQPRRALLVALLFLPLLVMFFRMPPIVYSLTIAPLPEPIEYLLYAPTALLAVVCVVLGVGTALGGRLLGKVGKDYRPEADGGPARP